MTTQRLGLIMNGVTGRMGLNQHLIRSIVAIRDQGGVLLSNGDALSPSPSRTTWRAAGSVARSSPSATRAGSGLRTAKR